MIDGLVAAVRGGAATIRPSRRSSIAGAGRTFIAGADIKGLEELAWGAGSGAPEMHDVLASIEDGAKPVVMALHGTALGGGLEVAMAGHYRVAVADAQMGQPEVNLGIIPGAEGTQRLPRLVGVEKAIEMCVTGKPIKAADALRGRADRSRSSTAISSPAPSRSRATSPRRAATPPRTRDATTGCRRADALPALLAAGRELAQEDAPQHGGAARRRRRDRGRRHAAVRRRLRPRARHLLRLRRGPSSARR